MRRRQQAFAFYKAIDEYPKIFAANVDRFLLLCRFVL